MAADLKNDLVLPFYEAHAWPALRISGRGKESCSRAETYDYQLFLAIDDIDHTRTKVLVTADQVDADVGIWQTNLEEKVRSLNLIGQLPPSIR